MHIEQLVALSHELQRQGCKVFVELRVELPVTQEHDAAAAPVATMKTVLWALNRLQAAPGQPNRELVRKFLYHRGWIGPTDQPEAWNLYQVPILKEQIAGLVGAVAQFEQEQHSPGPATPAPAAV
jgi:hypothetical protein